MGGISEMEARQKETAKTHAHNKNVGKGEGELIQSNCAKAIKIYSSYLT